MDEDLFSGITPVVSQMYNGDISSIPNFEEIQAAINDKNLNSTPGIDAFTAYFYWRYWDIIKYDLKALASVLLP